MNYDIGSRSSPTVGKFSSPRLAAATKSPAVKAGGNSPAVKAVGKSPVVEKKVKKYDKFKAKEYTQADISSMLEGYILVPAKMWEHIPIGAHMRYFKKNKPGETLPREKRFKPGATVKRHYETADGVPTILLETRFGDKITSFPVDLSEVEEIYKKFDKNSFIEVQLIYTSLNNKNKQIEDLTSRIIVLENKIKK